jgi:hypothetical protein
MTKRKIADEILTAVSHIRQPQPASHSSIAGE